jgi:hypothetical protein
MNPDQQAAYIILGVGLFFGLLAVIGQAKSYLRDSPRHFGRIRK